MLKRAIEYCQGKPSITTSGLQSALKVGYAKASGLIEILYGKGVVGEKLRSNGGRQVLLNFEAINE